MSYIQAKELSVTYPMEEIPALPPLNLDIRKGEKILILGPSGSGKSTLALALQGLIPRTIEAEKTGNVSVDGTAPENWAIAEACRHIGILFQDPDTQFCMETVEDEIIFGMENIGLPVGEMEERLKEVLKITGLEQRRLERLSSLSGGLKQKAAIACLLALDSDTYVLDEPTANLDPQSTEDILQLWIDIADRQNKTLLFIEHKMESILEEIDRVIALRKEGGILAEGPPREIFRRSLPALEEQGVWVPEICREALVREAEGKITWDQLPLNLKEWEAECSRHGIVKTRIENKTPARPAMDTIPILEASGLSFFYDKKQVLRDVCFTLQAGEFAALVGANGAGKSTLAHIISGIHSPSNGTLLRKGKPSETWQPDDIMKQTGFVFQNPEHQFITDTVEEELTYGWRMAGMGPEEWKTELEEMLDLFQLQEKRKANPFSLSQGQKRRLSVATMLTSDQELLVLDEPTFGQDEANTNALMNILKRLHRQGKTILMITHDMELVDQYTENVLLLDQGTIAYEGRTASFFEQTAMLHWASVQAPVSRELRQWRFALERQEAPC
ncbi:ABC transporter ATP-binding protein [Salibacterium aidingense]|uniref:ABC transporter ATP-binding protein n=1 Tax=Salibacterium aidingense TaxID=384933 RepID=UPI00041B639F|nr:ABC transporter ATP-binding protein [Salibacterium aidingense]